MNRQIRLVGVGLMALFIALFVQLNYLQVVHAPSLQHNTLNGEQVIKEYNLPRGAISSSDGTTLAYSRKSPPGSGFTYQRLYPTGSLFGQLTGYYSFIYGSDGVEKAYDSVLVGTKHSFNLPTNLEQLGHLLTNVPSAQNVTLTVADKLQALAQRELAGRDGSVVALNPSTGAILAMYSNPTYNPEKLSQLSTVKETKAWKRLLAASGNPLLPGTYRNRWFPGSTFKVITSAAVYDHQPSLATHSFPVLSQLPLPDTTNTLHNFGGETCGGSLPQLFTVSCDTGFGAIGLDLGGTTLEAEARAFGFDATPPLDLPNPARSYFPPASSFSANRPTLAYSAIGQEDVQATPLLMAMVAGAIADHGKMMTPHVLEKITNSQNAVVSSYRPKMWRRATSAATASSITKLMESVVSAPDGTGRAAAIPGVQVAAKTGTAQTGTGRTDDWMVAFAPAAHPQVAVAVLIPDQPSANEFQGGTVAAPIARAMLQAAISGHLTGGPTGTGPTSTTTAPATHTAPSTTPSTAPRTTPSTAPATTPVTAPPTTHAPVTAPPTTAAPPTTTAPPTTAKTGGG